MRDEVFDEVSVVHYAVQWGAGTLRHHTVPYEISVVLAIVVCGEDDFEMMRYGRMVAFEDVETLRSNALCRFTV